MHTHGTQSQQDQQGHEQGHEQRVSGQAKKPVTRADRILTLQRLAGNAAVSRAVEEERHEHGADCGHSGPAAEQPVVQRRVESLNSGITSPGRPLDPGIRAKAEQAYPMDFGHLLMHDGPEAQQSAKDFGAVAYTVGPHIVAAQSLDEETTLHEIDHAYHQALGAGAGTDDGSGVKLSSPDDEFEVKAADNGRKVARGEMPDLSLAGGPAGAERGEDAEAEAEAV